ncbi:MAG: hypothetical protein ACOY82_08095 [Pseudomonadota bacterium]
MKMKWQRYFQDNDIKAIKMISFSQRKESKILPCSDLDRAINDSPPIASGIPGAAHHGRTAKADSKLRRSRAIGTYWSVTVASNSTRPRQERARNRKRSGGPEMPRAHSDEGILVLIAHAAYPTLAMQRLARTETYRAIVRERLDGDDIYRIRLHWRQQRIPGSRGLRNAIAAKTSR